MSDPNFFMNPGFDTNLLYNPTPAVSVTTNTPSAAFDPDALAPGDSNPTTFNVFKVIIIVVLLILIGVTIALALIFRGNVLKAESQENPMCPIIACPVGNPSFPTCSADPVCGDSGFTTVNGKKICSATRYA
jgi:hypothetical protein